MIEVASNLAEMRALADAWNGVGTRFASPLLQHDWFLTAAEVLHREAALRVVAVKSGGRLRAIAPLVLARRQAATWLEIIGASSLFEPTDLLYEDEAALDELLRAVFGLGYPVLLSRVTAKSPVRTLVERRSRAACIGITRRVRGSSHVAVGGDWNAFLASLDAKARSSLRSRRRKAEEIGEVIFCAEHPAVGGLLERLQRAFAIEQSSWKGRSGSALLQNERLRQFFETYASRAAAAGTLRLFFLHVGGTAVAMRIAVERHRRLWFLKTGYDETFARLSPGIQLTHEMLRYACESGLDGCEFLGSDEPWQHVWPAQTDDCDTVVAYPMSARGALGALGTLVDIGMRRLARTPSKRRHPEAAHASA